MNQDIFEFLHKIVAIMEKFEELANLMKSLDHTERKLLIKSLELSLEDEEKEPV